MKKLYVTSDNWPFYLQEDGTLTDSPFGDLKSDLVFNSFEEFVKWNDDYRVGTVEDYKYFAACRGYIWDENK
jgi:hypothetical protein